MTTIAEALMLHAQRAGIEVVFGIPGVHTVELYRGLLTAALHHVTVRHEQGAAFMADGYARVCGRPAMCLLITGPGMTNAATALAQAFSDSVPVLAISSVNRRADLGLGLGRLHELPSQRDVIAGLTVFSHTLQSAAEIPLLLARAWTVFQTERPGPVHIEVPIDLLAEEASVALTSTPASSHPPEQRAHGTAIRVRAAPDPYAVAQAAALLQRSQRPVLIFGGGAADASPSALRLAERLQAPVLLTIAGKGVVDELHPLCLGAHLPFAAARELLNDADLVLAVGTELAETDMLFSGQPIHVRAPLIRVDIEAAQLHRNTITTVPILSDARYALDALLAHLPAERDVPQDSAHDARRTLAAIDRTRAALSEEWQGIVPRERKLLDALGELLTPDDIVVCDSTQLAYVACHYLRSRRPRSFLFPLGYGALGYGLPAAIGAKLAAPERTVFCISGDGGFLFTSEELATAMQQRVGLIILLWNNNAYGEIRDAMERAHVPPLGVDLHNPDFVALAEAYGCSAARPVSRIDFHQAVNAAKQRTLPTLIEIQSHADWLN